MCSKLILVELPLSDLTHLLKVALQTRHLSFGTDQNHKACRELKPATEEIETQVNVSTRTPQT